MRLGGVRRVIVVSLVAVALGGGAAPAGVGSAHERGAGAVSGALDEFAGLVELPSGREMYLECLGEGSPTVILESGGGLAASQWSVVAPGSTLTPVFVAVSQFTRVCAYDRPGTVQVPDGAVSRSDPVPLPRTFADMIVELRGLLEAADVVGPHVLAAHSMGGAVARLFAGQYPDDVAGFVSLDAADATIYESFVELVGPSCCDLPGVEFRVQEAIVELRAARPLPPVPMVVLAHSPDRQRFPNPLGWPADWPIAELLDIWDRAQEEIAALVPGAVLEVAEDSEHNIMIDQPVLVTDSIRAVVDAVLAGRRVAARCQDGRHQGKHRHDLIRVALAHVHPSILAAAVTGEKRPAWSPDGRTTNVAFRPCPRLGAIVLAHALRYVRQHHRGSEWFDPARTRRPGGGSISIRRPGNSRHERSGPPVSSSVGSPQPHRPRRRSPRTPPGYR